MKRRFNAMRPKTLIMALFIVSFTAILLVTLAANVFISLSFTAMERYIQQRLFMVSGVAAGFVSLGELNQYQRLEDMERPSYQALRRKLQGLAGTLEVHAVYYLRPSERGMLQYIIHSGFDATIQAGLDTPPRSQSQIPGSQAALAGRLGYSGLGNYAPGRRGLLSAYAPLFGAGETVEALAGVDVDDSPIVRTHWILQVLTAVQIVSVCILFISGLICLNLFRREAKQAGAASRAKTAFLAQTSHELRTPMNAVLGMSELALRSDTRTQALEHVEGIKQAGHSLLAIINNILDIANSEGETLEITRAPYSLASLLKDVIAIVRQRAAEKALILIVKTDAALPNTLLGDKARLRQVLINLLANAARHTSTGALRFTLRGEGGCPKARRLTLRFEVSGGQEQDPPFRFKPLPRRDRRKNQGTGEFGPDLEITRSICLALGGTLDASRNRGEGPALTLRLPQTVLDGKALASVQEPSAKETLCYEDQALYAEALDHALRGLGVRGTIVAQVEAFFQELAQGSYAFAFIPLSLAAKTTAFLKEKSLQTAAALMAEPGETRDSQGLPILVRPIYAVPAADALNRYGPGAAQGLAGPYLAPQARILAVDDIPANLAVIKGLLAAWQCRVDTAANGEEALWMVQRRQYDLVFMDHMMPVMDGIESVRHIRGLRGPYYQGLPIIAFTANAIMGMRELFLAQGFNDYLSKPIDTANLEALLNAWLPAGKLLPQSREDRGEDAAGLLDGLSLEGVDLAMGRARYREKPYLEVLRSYAVQTPALLEKLRGLTAGPLSEETIGDYSILIHGIKGAAYGICANDAAKQAEALEHAARRGDRRYIEANKSRFFDGMETLARGIRSLLDTISAQVPDKPPADAPDPEILRRLLEAGRQYKTSSMESALLELESYAYASGGDLVSWLRRQMDTLEYGAICKRLEHALGKG
ncbi:MAG: response regulator [Treponema sp.]|jgi:CheY-like chemotaxis protein/signal transduction histidine kinase|nr:response regulator [Treponema sp.]